MNNTKSCKQISKTNHLISNLLLREIKLDLMAKFMKIKSLNTKLNQDKKPTNYVAEVVLYNDIETI